MKYFLKTSYLKINFILFFLTWMMKRPNERHLVMISIAKHMDVGARPRIGTLYNYNIINF